MNAPQDLSIVFVEQRFHLGFLNCKGMRAKSQYAIKMLTFFQKIGYWDVTRVRITAFACDCVERGFSWKAWFSVWLVCGVEPF